MEVDIVIVNYNTADIIHNCIDSILNQQDLLITKIIVVDNNSDYEALNQMLNNKYAEIISRGESFQSIRLLLSNKNIGFGGGCNLGAKAGNAKYILFINPDAKFTTLNDMQKLFDFMENHPLAGLSGPRVVDANREPLPQLSYPGERHLGGVFKGLPGSIAWVVGACMMVRREVFEQIGGFDEDFFLYGEEADLQLRIRKAGHTIEHCPFVTVEHIGGQSERKSTTKEVWQKKQNGKHTFYRKHYTKDQVEVLVTAKLKDAQRKLFFLRIGNMLNLLNDRNRESLVRYETVAQTSKAVLEERH